ncbi:MAG: hypothetical protein GY716_19980 [bacterium]|nr:hypothetical protein [bacterium]
MKNKTPAASAAASRRPVLRFVVGFLVLIVPFSAFFYGVLVKTAVFESYLAANASAAAGLLSLFGEEARASGTLLQSPEATLEIRHGCDAILPTAIFLAAVLASPVPWSRRWPALPIGAALLLSINLVRIVSLYYTRVHIPSWFHTMHVDVWQPAFIFLALALWLFWALRAVRARDGANAAAA